MRGAHLSRHDVGMEVIHAPNGRDHRSVRSRVVSPDLVGRKAERAALVDALERAARGRAGIVLLGGDAGMGKTRLVQDLVAEAGRRACIVLVGGCVDLAEGAMPLAPLVGALRDLPRAVPAERLDDVIGAAAPTLAWLVPGLVLGDEGAPLASPARLFELLLGLLRRLSNEATTLVVFEDLHWADQSTRDLLVFLARNLTDERLLMVATFRTDELHRRHPLRPVAAELERAPDVERIDLRPLTREETAAQLAGIGDRPPPTDLVDEIHHRAEGNPFYAEELFAVAGSGDGGLPSTVRDAMLERLGTLGDRHQQVARVAAAVGRSVDDDLLAELVDLEPVDLDGLLPRPRRGQPARGDR